MTRQMKRNANHNDDTTAARSRSMTLPVISLFVPVLKPKQPDNIPDPFNLVNNDVNKSTDDEGEEYNELKWSIKEMTSVHGKVTCSYNDEEYNNCRNDNKIICVRKISILDKLKSKRKYSHV